MSQPTSNPTLTEEIESINAIYGTDTITAIASATILLRPPNQSISFLLSVSPDYPLTRPAVTGTQSTGEHGKGEGQHAVTKLEKTLLRVWTPGSVCLFDLIEEVAPLLLHNSEEQGDGAATTAAATEEKRENKKEGEADGIYQGGMRTRGGAWLNSSGDRAEMAASIVPDWNVSDSHTEKKSIFLAHCTAVTSASQAHARIDQLLGTNRKLASATHNITAWRARNRETGLTVQDCDDDGETAAGGRLLHLLQVMDVWNVVVVVSRWYGGVKLGPDRFRLINMVAREVLVGGGFFKVDDDKKMSKKKGKK